MESDLIDLADKVLETIPLKDQPGTQNWGRALGYI